MKKLIIALGLLLCVGTGAVWSVKRIEAPALGRGGGGSSSQAGHGGNRPSHKVDVIYDPKPQTVKKEVKDYPKNENINGFDVTWADDVSNADHKVLANLIGNMVYVKGGGFIMGSEEYMNTVPETRKNVHAFFMGKYEVTQKEWKAVMNGVNPSNNRGDNLPVDQVSYDDCQLFIKRLNSKTGLNFRLPSELEWEYAAKGGKKSRNYKFSGSDYAANVGWTANNSGGETHPVGQLAPNELGLYDMTGNVLEWVSDRYSFNYSEPNNNEQFVVRGGNYYWADPNCSNYFRYSSYPEDRWMDTGLRLVAIR